jgi:carbonic anhydrase
LKVAKSKRAAKSSKEKKAKKNKKNKKESSDKKNKAKKEIDLKALKRSSKVAKATGVSKKVTLSGKVLEQENSKKLKVKPFDPFQGMPENWLSDFESAMQKASLDPAQNGIGQVHYFLSEEGMEW